MTSAFNAKKPATWHAIAPTYDALTATNMDMLPWTALIKYHHQAHQHATEVTPLIGMIGPPLGIIATPDILTMITKLGTGSVIPNPTHITMGIGVAAIMTPIGAAPGHSTDPPNITSHATEAEVHTATAMTHHCRSSSLRNSSWDGSRDGQHKSPKQHYKPAQRSSSGSQATLWKNKDRRHKQVTIDDPPSEYYSSDIKIVTLRTI